MDEGGGSAGLGHSDGIFTYFQRHLSTLSRPFFLFQRSFRENFTFPHILRTSAIELGLPQRKRWDRAHAISDENLFFGAKNGQKREMALLGDFEG